MRSAQHEVIVISPYFVPGKDGVALMRELIERGVHIRVLTNSLASTDSPLVHIGYSHYRVALLKLGVELAEVRPKLGTEAAAISSVPQLQREPARQGAASIDQKTVFIGSLNMDARSARINSELGLVMRSAEIARQVTSLIDDISADGSYKLSLDAQRAHRVVERRRRAERIWHRDPETTPHAALRLEAARAVRAGESCSRRGCRRYGVMRMLRQVFLDLGAESLAAGHRRAARRAPG